MWSRLSGTSTSGNAGSDNRSSLVWRLLCVVYLIALVWLLLSMVPARLLDAVVADHKWVQTVTSVGHFACFFLLTLLVAASQWGTRRWMVVLGLVLFAAGSEPLQAQFTQRVPGIADCVQNLLGVACGCVLWWLAALLKGSGADHV